MKHINSLILLLVLGASSFFAQTKWNIDKSHSNAGFTVTHLVISEVDGYFKNYEGSVETNGDDFTNAKIEFSFDIASINTDNEKRDNHLKSDDFFNAEKFPKMTFKSKSFKKVDGKNWKLVGDLTIRDVTKQVTLDVKNNGTVKDPWGNIKAGFKIYGVINRFDYNLKWNSMIEAGGLVVGEDVEIKINLELAKQS
ncbi:MAG: YceI family protein [bacterium]